MTVAETYRTSAVVSWDGMQLMEQVTAAVVAPMENAQPLQTPEARICYQTLAQPVLMLQVWRAQVPHVCAVSLDRHVCRHSALVNPAGCEGALSVPRPHLTPTPSPTLIQQAAPTLPGI